jgi:hypothetical protein
MAKLSVRKYRVDKFDADYDALPWEAKDRFNTFTEQVSDTDNKSLDSLTIHKNGRLAYEFSKGYFVYWSVVWQADVVDGKVTSRPVAIQILAIEKL